MANNAKISFVGNLTKDPATRKAGTNTVTAFSVAVNTMNKNPDGSSASDFYDVSVWGKNGEYLMEKLQKGTQVWVTGDFATAMYDAKDGTKHLALRVTASDVRPLARMKGENTQGSTRGGYRDTGRGYANGYAEDPNAVPFF